MQNKTTALSREKDENLLTNQKNSSIISKYEDQPRDDKGRFAEKGGGGSVDNLSAYGANSDLPGFSKNNLDSHFGSGGFSDHSDQYPDFTKEQYAERAIELVRSATDENILGYKALDGAIIRYDKAENDWVRGYENGIATMLKLDDGEDGFWHKRSIDTRRG